MKANLKFYGKGADLESGLNTVNDWCFDTENGWRGIELYESGVASQLIIITASEAEFTGDIIPDLKQKVECLNFFDFANYEIRASFSTLKKGSTNFTY